MTKDERPVRVWHRLSTDRFSFCRQEAAQDDFTLSRAEAKRLVMDLIDIIDEPLDIPAETRWQPIETAPKDQEVLGWFPYYASNPPGGSVFVMRYDEDDFAKCPKPYWQASGWIWGIRDQREKQPTHWQPLPVPPRSEAEQ